jgi:hypothetical protein
MKLWLIVLLITCGSFTAVPVARACGGGVVGPQAATVGADAQRIIISVHGGITDVITQVGVPDTSVDYGVLIPVPSQPTLDPTPVPSVELDRLFTGTAPRIGINQGDDEPSCGCPVAAGSNKGGVEPPSGSTQVSQPVTIGPVTAVTLTADTGAAINAWLADNGFVIPASQQPIVDSYAGPGRYFIAIRRNDNSASGGATSVGVHFTLAGDQRGLPLRFASIGAGATVGFTVLVVADRSVAPSLPFEALKLTDLEAGTLRSASYAAALSEAIAKRGNHAFVVEGFWRDTEFASYQLNALLPFIPPGSAVTRLSTLLPVAALDTDIAFDQPFTESVPRERWVQNALSPGAIPKAPFGLALLGLGLIVRRRPRNPPPV